MAEAITRYITAAMSMRGATGKSSANVQDCDLENTSRLTIRQIPPRKPPGFRRQHTSTHALYCFPRKSINSMLPSLLPFIGTAHLH